MVLGLGEKSNKFHLDWILENKQEFCRWEEWEIQNNLEKREREMSGYTRGLYIDPCGQSRGNKKQTVGSDIRQASLVEL